MNLVFIHVGEKPVPEHMWKCIDQAIRFGNDEIYVVIPKQYIDPTYKSVIFVPLETLIDYDKNVQFEAISSKIEYHRVLLDFWKVTAQRFIILEALMKIFGLKHVIHMENDNTLYINLEDYKSTFMKLYKDCVGLGCVSESSASGGFAYIDTHESIGVFNDFMIESIANDTFQNEMISLKTFQINNPDKMKYLPVLAYPYYDKFSDNLMEFNSLFDPAGWGMFIGGKNTPIMGGFEEPGKKSIWPDPTYMIGVELQNDKYKIVWNVDDENRKCPYVIDAIGNTWPINNLHIHSKQIDKYV